MSVCVRQLRASWVDISEELGLSSPWAQAVHLAALPTASLSFRRLLVYQSLPGTFCRLILPGSSSQGARPDLLLSENGRESWNPPAAPHYTMPSSFLPALSNTWPAGAVLASTHDWEGYFGLLRGKALSRVIEDLLRRHPPFQAWQGQLPLCSSHTQGPPLQVRSLSSKLECSSGRSHREEMPVEFL